MQDDRKENKRKEKKRKIFLLWSFLKEKGLGSSKSIVISLR
jgi:hypothetical protein